MSYMYLCRVFKADFLFRSGFFLLFLFLLNLNVSAQVSLTNGAPSASIDFSAAGTPVGVGSAPGTPFAGLGFRPGGAPGELNSNAWQFSHTNNSGPAAPMVFSDGNLAFGGTRNTVSTDYRRGATTVAVTTGGVYAYTGAPASVANPILMIQPAVGDFTPGEMTLRIFNNGTSAITQFAIAYDLYVRNDQERSNSFNFQWSTDNVTYNNVAALDYTSTQASDVAGLVHVGASSPSRSTTITSQNVLPGNYFYIRWYSNDVGGSGSRDEFGLDNINIQATYGAACTPPATNPSNFGFSNVLAGQMDVSFTRGGGSGGLMVIAVENAALNANPFNGALYTASSNFGTGDAVGNGFVVYNSNAVLPAPGGAGSFTVLGLNPTTTYNFYFVEYNGVGSPCYQLIPQMASQSTIASVANPTGYFQSRITGNWNNANTWEYSPDNGVTPWVISDLKPTSAAAGIIIDSGHTVTMVSNESAAKLEIKWSGVLDNTNALNGGYRLTMVDKTGDDLTVNGTLKLYGNIPTLVTGLNAVVNTGGMVHVVNNNGDATSDDFARSAQVKFYTDAVFNWNTSLSFETDNVTYFTSGATDVPVFRISSNVSVGANSNLVVHGLLEVNATMGLQNNGLRTFRNGIIGSGTLNHTGTQNILVTATTGLGGFKIGGTGVINLSAELQFTANSSGILTSNKTINNGITKVLNVGYLNTDIFVISGSTNFTVSDGGFLGIGSPVGITTGAAGNIQTTTRTLSSAATYRYTGYGNQVTGNLLPAAVLGLSVQGPPTGGSAFEVTLSQPLTVTGTTSILNGWVLNIGSTSLTCNGSLSYSALAYLTGNSMSMLTLGGSGAQALYFKPGAELGLLTMNKTGGTVTLQTRIDAIHTGIFFAPSNTGTINFNNQYVTLKSGPTHTAYFSRLYGGVQNATRFTVERYIPTGIDHGRSWQLLAVPLNTTQTINQAWQDTATAANQVRYPGYGTMITGATNDPSFTLGFDAYTPLGSTLKTFVAGPSGSWNNIPNTKSTSIKSTKGFMVLVRGDRSVITVAPGIEVPTVLRATGSLYYGASGNAAPAMTIPANSFESIANPYACTIDFNLLTLNMAADKAFYVWDPLLPGSSNLGGYHTISQSAGWIPSPGGTLNYPAGIPVSTIQSGQAVLMHATGSMGTVVFSENNKVTASDNVFRQPVRNSMLQAHLYTSSGALADGNIAVFGNQFSNDYDGRDAVKFANTGENFGIAAHSKVISVLTRRPVVKGDTIQYQLWNIPRGRYAFKFTPQNFEGPEPAWLVDRFTGTETPLSRSDVSEYAFEISQVAGSYHPNRFYIVFRTRLDREEIERKPLISIAPNPVTGNRIGVVFSNLPAGRYQVLLLQAGGRVLTRTTAFSTGNDDKIYIDLPPAVLPGVYRLVVEGRQWNGDARVVVGR